jgi:hypothetical protein
VRDRPNGLAEGDHPSLESALDVSAGHIWPPVTGRSVLAIAGLGSVHAPARVRPFAPEAPLELVTAGGWVLHASERWTFQSEQTGRHALLGLVRRQLRFGELLPEGRAAFLVDDGSQWRIWVLTSPVATVREALEDVTARRDVKALERLWVHMKQASQRLEGAGVDARAIGGVDGVSVDSGQVAILWLGDSERARPPLPGGPRLLDRFLRTVAALAREDADLAAWLARHGIKAARPARAT